MSKRNLAARRDVAPVHETPTLRLGDGAAATLREGGLELRDGAGRLLFRYCDGSAEIVAPAGDLTLAAPGGRVRLQSALDIELDATRDVIVRAKRQAAIRVGETEPLCATTTKTTISGDVIEVRGRTGKLIVESAEAIATRLSTTAERVAYNVSRFEVTADRIVEKSRTAFRDVLDLLQVRVGRARNIVRDTYTLHAKRTTMVSEGDTNVTGRRVLLG